MISLNEFLKRLEIQDAIFFSNNNEVVLFDLWRIEADPSGSYLVHEKNAYGVWEGVHFCDCQVPLFVELGRVVFDTRHSHSFEEMLDLEQSLLNWKASFIDSVCARVKAMFDEVDGRITHQSEKKINAFVSAKLNELNLEKLSCLVSMVHSFFQRNFFTVKSLSEIFPFAPERIRISSIINLTVYSESIKIYNNFLPQHLAIVKFIHISPDLLKVIEKNQFPSKLAFAKFILSNIDDQARFENTDVAFFISCDHLTLKELAVERKEFIQWLQFFSKVSRNCKFKNIHLLYKEFMRIGFKNCLKNKKYVEAIFSFFQFKQFQNNMSDLNYALNYSLIINNINWGCSYSGNVDRFIERLDCSIDDIRKIDVFRAFMRFESSDSCYLKSGITYNALSSEFINELLINCHILVGLDWSESSYSDMGFVLQKVEDSYILIGSDNQQDRSFYHTIIVGDEVDGYLGSSHGVEWYFDQVLKEYAI